MSDVARWRRIPYGWLLAALAGVALLLLGGRACQRLLTPPRDGRGRHISSPDTREPVHVSSQSDRQQATALAPPTQPAPQLAQPTQQVQQPARQERQSEQDHRLGIGPPRGPSLDELLLFSPRAPFPRGNWGPPQLRYQDVWFTASDHTKLHGWYCPCPTARATILIAHGNAGNVATRAPWLRYLQETAGVNTFMFDYRGYGRSEGIPTVEGVLLDARAARAQLRQMAGVQDHEMVLMGESLGGAVVVELAAESAPRGLILQSTFSSLRDVAAVHFPWAAGLVPVDKLNATTRIQQYQGPLLQSHGTADGTIPLGLAEKLFQAANEPKTLYRVPGADHNNWLTDEYLEQLNRFIERAVAAKDQGRTGK